MRTGRALPFLILVALVVRLAAVLPVHVSSQTSEERVFLALAERMISASEFVDPEGGRSIRAPLFPSGLALGFLVAGHTLVFPYIVGCLLGSIGVALAYLLSIAVWGNRRAALATAAVIALYPGLVIYSALLQSETYYVTFFLAAMVLVYRSMETKNLMTAVWLGIVSALAALTRAAFLGFFPVLLITLWFLRKRNGLPAIRFMLVVFGAFCLVLSPWTARNYAVHGAFVPVATVTGGSLLVGNNPFVHGTPSLPPEYDAWVEEQASARGIEDIGQLSEVKQSALKRDIALDYMAANPGRTARLALQKLYVFCIYPITHSASDISLQACAVGVDLVLLLGVVIGLVPTRKDCVRLLPITAVLVATAVTHMVMHAEARYRLPLIPLLALLCGQGIALAMDRKRFAAFLSIRSVRWKVAALSSVVVAAYGLTGILFLNGVL